MEKKVITLKTFEPIKKLYVVYDVVFTLLFTVYVVNTVGYGVFKESSVIMVSLMILVAMFAMSYSFFYHSEQHHQLAKDTPKSEFIVHTFRANGLAMLAVLILIILLLGFLVAMPLKSIVSGLMSSEEFFVVFMALIIAFYAYDKIIDFYELKMYLKPFYVLANIGLFVLAVLLSDIEIVFFGINVVAFIPVAVYFLIFKVFFRSEIKSKS